jgi:outer membrane protein
MINSLTRQASCLKAFIIIGIFCIQQTSFHPATAWSQENNQAQTTKPAELPPLPDSPIEKAQKAGTALPMSLKDITKLALQSNLDIAIADTNEAMLNQKLISAQGFYDPSFGATFTTSSQRTANTSTISSSNTSYGQRDTYNWGFTFTQPVKTGGTLTTSLSDRRDDNNLTISIFNPSYSAGMTFKYVQPLLQNFRLDQNRYNIKIANLNIKTNESQFKQSVTNTIYDAHGKYWDLVSAIENYKIQRSAVDLARISLQNNQKKVEIGTLAPLDVVQSETQLANAEVQMIRAEEQINSAENAMRSVISNDRSADIWLKIIVPTDAPDFKEYKVNLDEAIDTALKSRPELEQLDNNIKQTDYTYELNRNSRKWKLDLTSQFGTVGAAGPQGYSQSGNLATPAALVGGFWHSYSTLFTEGYRNWSFQFDLTIPIRARTLEAQLAQTSIQKRQYLMNRKKTEQQILVEVRNDVQALETQKKQVETARVATRAAQEQLDGEEKRFNAGLSDTFKVLQQQNSLATAKNQELSALISYKKAVLAVQKAMYTLLESNDFEVAKGSSSNVPNLK